MFSIDSYVDNFIKKE